jgi:hypothetical protein
MKITEFHEIGSLNFIRYLLTLHSFIRIKLTVRVISCSQIFFDYSLIIDNQLNRYLSFFNFLTIGAQLGYLLYKFVFRSIV